MTATPATAGAAGTRFEHQVLKHLRANGYFAMRSPASKSPIDLVAIKPGQVLFVQCKLGGWLAPDGWNALIGTSESAGALPILATKPGRGRIAYARLTARKTGALGVRQPMVDFAIDLAEVTG